MNSGAKYVIGIGAGIVVQLVVILLSVAATFTGCHSAPLPGAFSFVCPLLFLVPGTSGAETLRMVLGLLSFIQFPAYGWLLARGWVRGTFSATLTWLGVAHGLAALTGLWMQTRL
jgi:hypothetical protein